MFQSGGQAGNSALIHALGLDVDDDNIPAPENIPDTTTTTTRTRLEEPDHIEGEWGWSRIDCQK